MMNIYAGMLSEIKNQSSAEYKEISNIEIQYIQGSGIDDESKISEHNFAARILMGGTVNVE